MANFMENLKDVLGEEMNVSVTENGAIGYRTSGHELLDLNFKITSLRDETEGRINTYFDKAYYENPLLAMKWLFYASDVRAGVGERRLFKIIFKHLAFSKPEVAKAVLDLIPEYSRYDNMFVALDTELHDQIVELVKDQLTKDMEAMKKGEPISLLAKWMPSNNTSSKQSRIYASEFSKCLGLTPREYRKVLVVLRKYLNIIETHMCQKEWGSIDYSKVPSRANLLYKNAFMRNDQERRLDYLESLSKNETKINASVLFPHDIVHKYNETSLSNIDTALEEMWKALPNTVQDNDSTICVMDGSGSMYSYISKKTTVNKVEVANALAIYFAEKCHGQFKDKFISFSERPQLIDISRGTSLLSKLKIIKHYEEIANTNVEAVFDLILLTALKYKMTQDQIPKNILILSDMEFDECAVTDSYSKIPYHNAGPDAKLFQVIKERYEAAGYKIPRMIFWNIGSSTGTIPVKENDCGVALVSGFSTAVMKMVMSNKMDPYECLVEQLNTERYLPVEEALKDVKLM